MAVIAITAPNTRQIVLKRQGLPRLNPAIEREESGEKDGESLICKWDRFAP
jgi:hypothetical protein